MRPLHRSVPCVRVQYGPEFDAILPVCICPRETVCVKRLHDLIFLVFARASAYFDYPLYVMAFVSKAHNLQGALQRPKQRKLSSFETREDGLQYFVHERYCDECVRALAEL